MLPTDQQIIDLHHKYAKTDADFQLVYQHCQIIETIAMKLLDAKPIAGIDRQLVHVGCMLHDIGTYKVLENGVFVKGVRHGVFGEEILKEEGYPESLWRIASHHTGVGLTEQDVIEARRRVAMGERTVRLAPEYGVGLSTLARAVNGRSWSHVAGALTRKGRGRHSRVVE